MGLDGYERIGKKNLVLPYAHPQSPVAVICYVISLCLAYVVVPAAKAPIGHHSPVLRHSPPDARAS